MPRILSFLTAALLSASGIAPAAQPGPSPAAPAMPRFASQASAGITCDLTPFGRYVTLGQDAEFVNLYANGFGINNFDIHVLDDNDQLVQDDRAGLLNQGALAGTTFLSAVAVDLDGDGRDEVVSVHRVNSGSTLRLGVFHRTAADVTELVQTWNLARTYTNVELVAGDLDGSADGQQELGLFLRGTSPAAFEVHVLTGTSDARIAQADNQAAGRWTRTGVFGQGGLAVGDMLLNGREQLVVVNDLGTGGSRSMNFHLIEYLPSTPALPIVAGDVQVGSYSHSIPVGSEFRTDDALNPGISQVTRMRAVAGDLTDSAAAELAVLMQFNDSSFNYVGLRLHHFTTTRNALNEITGIGFFSRGGGIDWGSSQLLVGQNQDTPPSFDAAIASIDRVSPGELVIARQDPSSNRLVVEAFKATVDLSAGFSWTRDGNEVSFTDQSTGLITAREWDFGDGSGPVYDPNPVHTYAAAGSYNVRLRLTAPGNVVVDRIWPVQVGPGIGSGGEGAQYRYRLNAGPTYADSLDVDSGSDLSLVRVAVGDMDRDGIVETMTVVNDRGMSLIRSLWKLSNTADPNTFEGQHVAESLSDLSGMAVVAADVDGDSLIGTLGTDCRQVQEPQLRQLVWLPPYWQRWQAGANKVASFGESTSGISSTETRAGMFTSHSVSGYVGATLGIELELTAAASARVTAGYNYQSAFGALRGTENSFRTDQSFSQSSGEALLTLEENSFNCYRYDVGTASEGLEPDSGLRMCELLEGTRLLSATDARSWDEQIPAAPIDNPPAQWVPLHRDWASLSLFRPVTGNISLAVGSSFDQATDGLFGTALTASAARSAPWIQIDLGEVRDISNIRVFPREGQAALLRGFRIHASQTPMTGDAVPSGAGVRTYAPETGDDMAYSQWNIWTRSRSAPHAMLRARYIRLQHPGTATLDIAQIQVFGDVHVEPPAYPDAVCDPFNDDGWFLATVWDAGAGSLRPIEVRGDLLWNGSAPNAGSGVDGCTNYSGLQQASIWEDTVIGSSGTPSWNLSSEIGELNGSDTSIEHAVRVGAEFDGEAGFILKAQGGGAYEFTAGITEDVQSSQYWGRGLEVGGEIGGFATSDQQVIEDCRYIPRPYAFRMQETSNTGYVHQVYVVDYVVRQIAGLWQRDSVPVVCREEVQLPVTVFVSGFED